MKIAPPRDAVALATMIAHRLEASAKSLPDCFADGLPKRDEESGETPCQRKEESVTAPGGEETRAAAEGSKVDGKLPGQETKLELLPKYPQSTQTLTQLNCAEKQRSYTQKCTPNTHEGVPQIHTKVYPKYTKVSREIHTKVYPSTQRSAKSNTSTQKLTPSKTPKIATQFHKQSGSNTHKGGCITIKN